MAKTTPERSFVPAGFFSFRTPLLPFEELEAFSEGLEAPAAAGDPERLEGALAADRRGTLRRSADVLDLLDGPRGRYLVTRGDDGWTTVAPTDDRRLRHRVVELLDAARGGARDTGRRGAQSRSPWRMSCRPDSVIEPDSDG